MTRLLAACRALLASLPPPTYVEGQSVVRGYGTPQVDLVEELRRAVEEAEAEQRMHDAVAATGNWGEP